MALRHARQGRQCIERQLNIIATLRARGLPTDEAERVLLWLEEVQRSFENHYNRVLLDGRERIAQHKTALAAKSAPPPPVSRLDRQT